MPKDLSNDAKEQIGDLLVNEIKRYTYDGKSPVSGEGNWKKLNKKYANDNHKGDRTPRLRLDGDMMDSLGFEIKKNGNLIVGILEQDQQKKADGHNNFTGSSELPRRRFIPGPKQTFKKGIMSKVNEVIASDKPNENNKNETSVANLLLALSKKEGKTITADQLFAGDINELF